MFSIRCHTRTALVAALSLLAVSAACGGTSSKPPSPDVWATVDDHQIKQDDVLKTWRREAQAVPTSTTDDEALMAQLSVVDEMITQEVLMARARELKLDVADADVDKAYTDRKANMSDDQFQAALKERTLTPDDLRQALRRDLMTQKVLDREVSSRVDVTDAEVSDFYAAHRADFNVRETQYHIAQIVITPVKDPAIRNRKNDDATTPDEAKRKFDMLMAKLKAGGDFAQIAMDYSEDPQTAPQGGDLGFISASQLSRVPPQLRDLVLKTEPGNVGTASAGGGYTMVALIARELAGQRDLSAPGMRDNVRNTVKDRKEQLLRAAYLTKLRNNAKIMNYLAWHIVDAQSKPPSVAPSGPGK
jgi:peptidyl-prolyl cis-trans isomerase SurA